MISVGEAERGGRFTRCELASDLLMIAIRTTDAQTGRLLRRIAVGHQAAAEPSLGSSGKSRSSPRTMASVKR